VNGSMCYDQDHTSRSEANMAIRGTSQLLRQTTHTHTAAGQNMSTVSTADFIAHYSTCMVGTDRASRCGLDKNSNWLSDWNATVTWFWLKISVRSHLLAIQSLLTCC